MPEWFTPPQVAKARAIRVSKVLAWIARGELEAVNFAERAGGRPRWRIRAEAMAAFEAARSNRTHITPKLGRPRRADPGVLEFF